MQFIISLCLFIAIATYLISYHSHCTNLKGPSTANLQGNFHSCCVGWGTSYFGILFIFMPGSSWLQMTTVDDILISWTLLWKII